MKRLGWLGMAFSMWIFVLAPVRAYVLTTLPGPDDQGGMIMPNVYFNGQKFIVSAWTDTEENTIGAGMAELANLAYWSPGDTLNPSDPWYNLLDPVGGSGLYFSNRFGLTMDPASEFLPDGTSIGVRLVSSTAGISFYNYRSGLSGTALFDQVFFLDPAQENDYVLWNGNMWHFYAVADAPGTYSATFEIFLADAAFQS